MVEGQFVLKGVTRDDLKFYHVLGSLQETAEFRSGDLMHRPQTATCYYMWLWCQVGLQYVTLWPDWLWYLEYLEQVS